MTECPLCDAESEYSWRCSECGKLLEGDDGGDRDARTDGGDGIAADETEQIEISKRQRERIEGIKAECSDDHLPEPTDQQIVKSLLDTWDAVDDGHYSDGDRDV